MVKKTEKTTGRKKITSTNKLAFPYRRSPWRELYKGQKMQGKPPKYTKEYLEKMADRMYQWVQDHPDAVFLRPFFSGEEMHHKTVYDVLHVSEKFESTYRGCQQICADRLHEQALRNKINGVYATRFMHFFDGALSDDDREVAKKRARDQFEIAKEVSAVSGETQVILKVEKE